jgi:hypothetical protein
MGIEQLVDMYKGNPGPLEAKVEKNQQGQKPGELPEDLEEAIALQKIAELQNGAKNQQAMQAGGAQPSIVEKLKQMLAAQQRQQAQPPQMPQGMPQGMPPQQGMPQMPQMAQGQPPMPQGQPPMPQGQPVMAARGGSIDQLISNLGRHYAGGGIIAFNGEDGSDVPTEKELEAQRKADREKIDALARALGQTGGEYAGKSMAALADIASLIPRGLAGAADTALIRPLRALGAKVDYLSPALTPGNQSSDTMTPFYDRYIRAKEGAAPTQVKPTAVPDAALDPESEKLKRLAAVKPQTGQNTNPDLVPRKPVVGTSPDDVRQRPSAPRPSAGESVAPAAALDPNSLRGLIEANIRKELGKDEDAEWRKGSKRYEDFMGLDKLLQPREARIAERQEMLKRIQGERTPAWVEALVAAGRPVRGGLGTLLSQMGGAAESTRRGYSAEDLKFFDEIGAMQDEVAKLKLDGKYKAAAAGESAIKDMIANKRQAEQSGTSLVKTDEDAAARIQQANIAAQARRDAAAGRGAGSGDKQQLNELKALQTSMKDQLKDPRMMGKAGDELRRQLAAVNAEIAKMAGLSTMAAAPSAASPSGTRPPLSSFQR